jgi:predicted DNA-binding transcriptional regulator YafY
MVHEVIMASNNSGDRLAFILLLIYWRGYIRNKDLQTQFSISRQQAYNDIRDFISIYPDLVTKNESGLCMVAESTSLVRDIPSLDAYLNWLLTGHFNHRQEKPSQEDDHSQFTAEVSAPARHVSRDIISCLTQAMEQNRRVEIGYVSLTAPEFDGRIFHPHTFVKTGQRWHVRGYCEKSQAYRDLVLSRCRGEVELLDQSIHPKSQDTVWNTFIDVIISPDPRLTASQQEVICHDYNMQDGQLVIHIRAALAAYLLKDMQVSTKYLDGVPEAQQLILVNRNDIKAWLFDG